MAFTSTDRTNIESAITALATGQAVARVRFADGEEVTYSQTDIPTLQKLLGQIKNDISAATTGNKRYRHVVTSKGY